MAGPRRRLAAIVHRTEQVLADSTDLRIALQPIVDLEGGRWVGVEALARFPDNDPPERWFAEAHEAGMGVALEKRVVQDALKLLPELPPDVRLAVNASPALILDPDFTEMMHGLGTARERVTIEITEHEVVARYEDIRAALSPHRERGLRLAVDDTGAGYASFAHVLLLRPDVIKLDRSLLDDTCAASGWTPCRATCSRARASSRRSGPAGQCGTGRPTAGCPRPGRRRWTPG